VLTGALLIRAQDSRLEARPSEPPTPVQPFYTGATLRPHLFSRAARITPFNIRSSRRHSYHGSPIYYLIRGGTARRGHRDRRPLDRSPGFLSPAKPFHCRQHASGRAPGVEMSAPDHQGDPVRAALSRGDQGHECRPHHLPGDHGRAEAETA